MPIIFYQGLLHLLTKLQLQMPPLLLYRNKPRIKQIQTSQVVLMVKNLLANAGDTGCNPESGRPPEGGNGNPLQYSCLENPHGPRSLVGHSAIGHKESDMTAVNLACTHR